MRAIACSLLALAALAAGCDAEPPPSHSGTSTASIREDVDVGVCASTFGDQLTPGFGRIDGSIVAIVRPVIDEHCTMPNRDHVIAQVEMLGSVYRLLVNVKSDRPGADERVRFGRVDAPLPAPEWEEGWHAGLALDYVATLGQHSEQGFAPLEMNPLVSEIVSELHVGEKISVYAVSGAGRPESAHKIHRNRAGASQDGAIVVAAATKAPRFLLFHFDGQTF